MVSLLQRYLKNVATTLSVGCVGNYIVGDINYNKFNDICSEISACEYDYNVII